MNLNLLTLKKFNPMKKSISKFLKENKITTLSNTQKEVVKGGDTIIHQDDLLHKFDEDVSGWSAH